ncbi:MAG: UDP-N-acetylmuramoyl-tripeptide--D-alanyl-D-alanine ligase, partial [Selenomonadaceae bacterium]|nr:UDP-N-acetylmuramoyl-tripeptide--D-alanyl-D-alanine ligase [Selenomonadaceae bacterium]
MNKFTLAEIILVTGAETNSDDEIFFEDVLTDSRKITGGSLFVALKGENFNGEDFAEESLKKGAAAVLVSKNFDKKINGVVLKVDDTLDAYRKIAGAWRNRFDIPLVAV